MEFSNKKSTWILPTDASEGKLEEKMIDVQFEVMDTIAMTPNLVSDTETSKAIVSNLDQAVSFENKSDGKVMDFSKTRETSNVCLTMSRTRRA